MGRYDGKRVVVVGGTSGIGLATARLVLDEGARVLVVGVSEDSVAGALDQLGGDVRGVAADIASPEGVRRIVQRAQSELGGVDLLAICAGITRFVDVADMTEEVYDQVMAINARGPYFLMRGMVPLFADPSAIVVVTSVSGVKGQAGSSAYAASKAALRSMVRSFARELQPRGIRVNAVSPGPIETGILERSVGSADAAEGIKQGMRDRNPMGRFGEPDEVAGAIAFLGFEATYTTGAELAVDGGTSQL